VIAWRFRVAALLLVPEGGQAGQPELPPMITETQRSPQIIAVHS
jgi:hypothetical protein